MFSIYLKKMRLKKLDAQDFEITYRHTLRTNANPNLSEYYSQF